MKKQALAAFGVLLLASCAGSPESTSVPVGPVAGFECPPAGTTVTYDSGVRLVWNGADPQDPAICLQSRTLRGQTTERRVLFNFWGLPAPEQAEIRRAMAGLFPLAPGRQANFGRSGTSGNGTPVLYSEQYRVTGREPLAVAGQQRDAWIITWSSSFSSGMGGGFNGQVRIWVDVETKVVLRQQVLNGHWVPTTNFAATDITVGRR